MSYLGGFMGGSPDYNQNPGIIGLQQYIQSGYDAGKAKAQNQALAQLSQKAYTDTGDAQKQDISQAIGIDPQTGYALAGKAQEQNAAQQAQKLAAFQRLGKAASAIIQAKQAGDETTAEGIYQAIVPELGLMSAQHGGPTPPPTLQGADMGALYKVAAMYASLPQPDKGVVVSAGGAVVNPQTGAQIYRNPYGMKYENVPMGAGQAAGAFDPNTGTVRPATGGAPQMPVQGAPQPPSPGMNQTVPGANGQSVQFNFPPGTPPEVIAAAKASAVANGDIAPGALPQAAGVPQAVAAPAQFGVGTKGASSDLIAQRAQQLQELKARGVTLTEDQRQAYLANGRLPSGSDAILAASMDTPLTPAAMDESAVDFILKGPRGLPAYAYRDPVTAKQIQNHAGEMLQAAGLSPTMLPALRGSAKARESALVKMQAQGSMLARNIQSLDANVQMMLDAAQKVGNTNFKSWNALVLAAKGQVSDPAVAAYAQAVMNVLDDYGKVMSMSTTNQGTTDTQLRLAQQRISQAEGLPALKATADMIEAGGKNIRDKTDASIANLTNALQFGNLGSPTSVTTGAPGQQAAPAASGAPAPGTIEQGYRFKGGDPSQQSNWEPVQ